MLTLLLIAPAVALVVDDPTDAALITDLGATAAPAGVTVTWSISNGLIDLALQNDSAATVVLSWDTSVFIDQQGLATPIAPGSAALGAIGGAHPPLVVPAGTRGVAAVVRKDHVDLASGLVRPALDLADATCAIDLDLLVDGRSTRLRQSLGIRPDAGAPLVGAVPGAVVASEPAVAPDPRLAAVQAARQYESLRFFGGEICMDGPMVAAECYQALGKDRGSALAAVEARLAAGGCEAATETVRESLLGWRAARRAGNVFLVTVFGAPATMVAWYSASQRGEVAEGAYAACMSATVGG